jgi:transposase
MCDRGEVSHADVIRILAYRPRDRYLELAPKYWGRTRARLDQRELELPIGHVSVPPPPALEQPSSS